MTQATIVQPGAIERPPGEIPYLHIPETSSIFRERAGRLRTLAQNHRLHDFLQFMAVVCDAQQAALDTFPRVPLPSKEHLSHCREHGMPPLSVDGWQRSRAWRDALKQIADRAQEHAVADSRRALARLQLMDDTALEMMANAILDGHYAGMDMAAMPFVAAALQVYWTHMAGALGADTFGRSSTPNLCPVCASSPVASIVRIGGAGQGLRYLSCSLCATQWHMVRVKCSNCESTKGIAYYAVEGASAAVKAESCDVCDSYLKIVYMDKDPYAEPVADDLATLALDLLMDDAGKARSGPNLFLTMDPVSATSQ